MGALAVIVIAIGAVLGVVGGIWLLVVAFQESVLWGLGSIFVPFVSLIFVILHWDVAKKPFLYNLLGTVILFVGAILMALVSEPSAIPM